MAQGRRNQHGHLLRATLTTMGFIDITIAPFTHAIKASVYARVETLRESYEHLGIWDGSYSVESLIEAMDSAGVEKALIKSQAAGSWEVSYEAVHDIVAQIPERLRGLAAIDPRDVMGGLRRLEFAVLDLGFVGAHSFPHWFGLPPDDRTYYPFYAKCVELDVPMQVQAGQAFQSGLRSVGRPAHFDAIAVDFPELRLVATHTGYPWERELISVAWKHPNVYIGADSHNPARWAHELVDFIRVDGREKVLFGTNYPVIGFQDALDGVAALGFDDGTRSLLLSENARRVYAL